MKENENFISTGCPKLDIFLGGGIPRRGITQIYGESGLGKTQLALQLCLSAQIPFKFSNELYGSAYICTESRFPSTRLYQLLKTSPIRKEYPVSDDMVFIEHISTTDDLMNCICDVQRLPHLLSKYKINLLVIDSIAATYRSEYESTNVRKRARCIRTLGYELQKLANIHEMAIVCINQVTAVMRNSLLEQENQPSLGITWASMVTNSLSLHKTDSHRYLSIAGSPYLPCKTIEYRILESGFTAIN